MMGRPENPVLLPKVERFLDTSTQTMQKINYLDPVVTQGKVNNVLDWWGWVSFWLCVVLVIVAVKISEPWWRK